MAGQETAQCSGLIIFAPFSIVFSIPFDLIDDSLFVRGKQTAFCTVFNYLFNSLKYLSRVLNKDDPSTAGLENSPLGNNCQQNQMSSQICSLLVISFIKYISHILPKISQICNLLVTSVKGFPAKFPFLDFWFEALRQNFPLQPATLYRLATETNITVNYNKYKRHSMAI